jgi:hypothetical protein
VRCHRAERLQEPWSEYSVDHDVVAATCERRDGSDDFFLPYGRDTANWSAAGAIGGAVVFALVDLLGFWYAPSTPTETTQDIDTWFTDTIPNWLTWTTSLAGGLTLVAVIIVVATVPASIATASRRRDRWPRWRTTLVLTGALVLATAVLLPASVAADYVPYALRVGWLADSPVWAVWRDGSPGLVTIAAVVVLACAAAATVLVGVLGGGRSIRVSAAVGAPLTIILAVLGPLTNWCGILGTVLAAARPLLAGAAVWLTIGRLLRRVVQADPIGRESPLARGMPRLRGTGWLIALLLSVPLASYAGAGTTINWYTFPALAASIDGCLALLVVGILMIVAYSLGSPKTPDPVAHGSYAALRAVAVLIAVVGLLTSSATVAGIPVAFVTGWTLIELWLLPRRGAPEDVLVHVGADARKPAVGAVVNQARDAAESRAVAALERGLRKDLAAEAISPEDRAARVERIKALAATVMLDSLLPQSPPAATAPGPASSSK